MQIPETHFARVGDDRVAYQVLGDGPRDLLYTSGLWSHLDIQWEDGGHAALFRRLASMGRLIRFDRRGTGESDRPAGDGGSIVERWVQDYLAVLDEIEAKAPIIVSVVDSGPIVLEFVKRHPERCSGLVFINTVACLAQQPDYPQGLPPERVRQLGEFFAQAWGNAAFGARWTPSQAGNPAVLQWFSKLMRAMASPRMVAENFNALMALDARPALATVRVPTLVMARRGLAMMTLDQARYVADHIAGARFVELPGSDGTIAWESPDLILDHIEEFVTGHRRGLAAERALAAILFTDIVDSTRLAAEAGDGAWRRTLDLHDQAMREQLALFGGRLVELSGDGTLATFDHPGRALDCARALIDAVRMLGLNLRAGLHFGEVEQRGDRVGGIAVHIGARVMAHANGGEVLASRTVHDVLIGSRYRFEEQGTHALKGVPGQWTLYALATT